MSRVLVVGAGIAGLTAATALAEQGHRVSVVDKGRGPGGRMATRRIGPARLDHGAQFWTVRSDRFARMVEGWEASGLALVWCHGFALGIRRPGTGDTHEACGIQRGEGRDPDDASDTNDGHPRYFGVGGMTAPAKSLAEGLDDVRCGTRATAIVAASAGGWVAHLEDGTTTQPADTVICTPPVPQTLALLETGRVAVDPAARQRLARIRYDPTLALLVTTDEPTAVPHPGGLQLREDDHPVWSWVGDNAAKGLSPVPAVTFHAHASVSRARFDDDRDATMEALAGAVRPWVPGPAAATLMAWRYAAPSVLDDERCVIAVGPRTGHGPIVCAGDAFGEARVEGAVLSGLAAADAVADALATT